MEVITTRTPHKRTIVDDIKRKINPEYKSKLIKKSEYIGEWPFYAEEVIIECRNKNWAVVSIDGYDYALNGNAKSKYKLANVHDAGKAIIGMGIGDFILMTLALSDDKYLKK